MKRLWNKVSDWWDRQDYFLQFWLVWLGMLVIGSLVIDFLLHEVGWCSCLFGGGE